MNILILGPNRPTLNKFFEDEQYNINYYEDKLYSNNPILDDKHFIISFGYRYLIDNIIINKFKHRIINLHISYLPWNRGADPNLWSILEDSPKGVTIHYIDKGLDTGDIIVQQEVFFSDQETLHTTYQILIRTIENLLMRNWFSIYTENIIPIKQPSLGSYHNIKDKSPYMHLLTEGWNTPIKKLIGKAKEIREEK